jgi:hypothetical protein
MNVRPIETFYNGYRFRSRLEARWAVFFDNAFIEYQYEPEGYVLDDGSCYLPDFYLPLFHMFVEIKPLDTDERKIHEAENKLLQIFNANIFSQEGDGITVALFRGEPLENDTWIFCREKTNGETGCGWYPMKFMRGIFGEYNGKKYCFKKTETVIGVYCSNNDTFFDSSAFDGNARLVNATEIKGCLSTFKSAKFKARQARFEFGERG